MDLHQDMNLYLSLGPDPVPSQASSFAWLHASLAIQDSPGELPKANPKSGRSIDSKALLHWREGSEQPGSVRSAVGPRLRPTPLIIPADVS